jgi:hypothetical protein
VRKKRGFPRGFAVGEWNDGADSGMRWERVEMVNARCTSFLIEIDERGALNRDKFTRRWVTIRKHRTQWGSEAKEKRRECGIRNPRSPYRQLSHGLSSPLPGLPENHPAYERPGQLITRRHPNLPRMKQLLPYTPVRMPHPRSLFGD